jgi:N-acetylglutamate synthase-like GNAT family acetyltransferase
MDDKHVEYRHKGIGKNLLDLIRRECTEEGASVVHCQVISMEMLGLVNKLGFENVPNTPTFLLRLKRAHEENVA